MSTRTILEFNHDYFHDLDTVEAMTKLLHELRGGFLNESIKSGRHIAPGVRVLAQRHHSEALTLKVY